MRRKMSEFNPIGARVLLKLIEVETKTAGGILLPDSVTDKEAALQQDATIVSMGSVAFQHEVGGFMMDYPDKPRVGDKVRIIKYAGDPFVMDGGKYRIVNDCDILAVSKQ